MKPIIRDIKPIIRLNNSHDIRVLGMPSTMHQKKSPLYYIQDRKSLQRPQFSSAEHQYARMSLSSSYPEGRPSYLQPLTYRYPNRQPLRYSSNYMYRQPINSTGLYRTQPYLTSSRVISTPYNGSTSQQRISSQSEESLKVSVRIGRTFTYGNKKV